MYLIYQHTCASRDAENSSPTVLCPLRDPGVKLRSQACVQEPLPAEPSLRLQNVLKSVLSADAVHEREGETATGREGEGKFLQGGSPI